MSLMIAFGLASIMLCIGMVLRTKIPFLRNMLVPASVIAGVLGIIIMNTGLITGTDAEMFTSIVTFLFTITFISIGLTSSSKSVNKEEDGAQKNTGKEIAKGSLGMGFTWNILYALIPVVGAIVILLIGGYFGMNPFYGLLIPFAFTQGPGQATTFGTIFEQQYGIENAAMVGVTFAAIGFLACFLVGVPLAKYGLKKGLVKSQGETSVQGFIQRGYYTEKDERAPIGRETVYSGNMDTMTFHFAIIGVCFVMALGMAELVSLIPGVGSSLSGMLFIYGMLAGYLVKFIMKKLHMDHLLDNVFQTKITGWSTDYLVVASFMAVQFSVIGAWLVPILTGSAIAVLLTVAVVIYFCQRMGGTDDFLRTLGLFGTATGTVPSGLALVRIVDPSLRSNTAVELGMMNIAMFFSFPTVSTILLIASGAVSMTIGILLLLAPIPVYLIVMKVSKVWGKKTYELKSSKTASEKGRGREEYVS